MNFCNNSLQNSDSESTQNEQFDPKSNYKYLKEIDKSECLTCGKLLSGKRTSNLKRHYNQIHESSAKDPLLCETQLKSKIKKYIKQCSDEPIVLQTNGPYMHHYEDNFTKLVGVWSNKLQQMEPYQQLFAEKFINDILFEGLLGNLKRDSIQINVNNNN